MKYLGPETEILHERYARAIFGVAKESKELDRVAGDLSFMSEMVRKNKGLGKILGNPEIDKEEKLKMLEVVSKKVRFSRDFFSLLQLLVKKQRTGLIHGIFLRYRDLYDREKGLVPVFVKSAIPLEKTQIARLGKALSARLKKDVKIQESLTPSAIGGFDVRIKDMAYNLSLADRLKAMKERLKGV